MSRKEGYVFVLINDAMPGFVRVDFSPKNDVGGRILKINQAAPPVPFRVYLAAKVIDWKLLSRNLRFLFQDYCDPENPDFYTVNPELIRAATELSIIEMLELPSGEIGISATKQAQMDKLRTSHQALKFLALKAEPGTRLYFARDPSISCTVANGGLVSFAGEETTPAVAAERAFAELGFDWSDLAGTDYWTPVAPVDARRAATSEAFDEDEDEDEVTEALVVPSETENSPVMFIRNSKS